MIKRIGLFEFKEYFRKYDGDNSFSEAGLEALFYHLEAIHGCEYELDVVDLCCNFDEFETIEEVHNNYKLILPYWFESWENTDYGEQLEIVDISLPNKDIIPVGTEGFIISV